MGLARAERVALAEQPTAGDRDAYGALGVNLDGDDPGWALAGTVGAVGWGAPMVIGAAFPPDFYVPSAVQLRQATLRLGEATRFEDRASAGLVDRQNRPIIPDLFWELVAVWHERPTAIATFPGLDGPFDQLSWLGLPDDWVLTDTQAALLLGAPVIASSAGPPDFYVREPSTVAATVAHFGPANEQPAATVRPIRYTGIRPAKPFRRTAGGIQVAHPVVVALDLAHDRARGREIVEQWDPLRLGVTRVW